MNINQLINALYFRVNPQEDNIYGEANQQLESHEANFYIVVAFSSLNKSTSAQLFGCSTLIPYLPDSNT